jgi:polyhydroxyalkanoate synthesis regulator phasin
MIDLLKKTLLAGVGAAVTTKEKIEDTLDQFVRQGKINAQDARIMADKIAEQGRKEFDELAGDLGDRINDTLKRAKSDHEVRIADLEERIRVLEAAMAEPPTRSGEP